VCLIVLVHVNPRSTGMKIALAIQAQSGKMLKDFLAAIPNNEDVKVRGFYSFLVTYLTQRH
jgi:hypothetical protein